jgi:UDP-glucose 4-epimerase
MKGGDSVTVNLGTGSGISVLEIVAQFETASGRPIARRFVARRGGDVGEVVADAGLAERLLGWKAKRDVRQMCEDHWRWQERNPNGF